MTPGKGALEDQAVLGGKILVRPHNLFQAIPFTFNPAEETFEICARWRLVNALHASQTRPMRVLVRNNRPDSLERLAGTGI